LGYEITHLVNRVNDVNQTDRILADLCRKGSSRLIFPKPPRIRPILEVFVIRRLLLFISPKIAAISAIHLVVVKLARMIAIVREQVISTPVSKTFSTPCPEPLHERSK